MQSKEGSTSVTMLSFITMTIFHQGLPNFTSTTSVRGDSHLEVEMMVLIFACMKAPAVLIMILKVTQRLMLRMRYWICLVAAVIMLPWYQMVSMKVIVLVLVLVLLTLGQPPGIPPVQPVNAQFPKAVEVFNPAWYGSYECLEHSVRLILAFATM